MNLVRMRLSDGVDPRHAANTLRAQIGRAGEISARPEFQAMQGRYLQWVEGCEVQLPYLTADLEALRMFDTPRSRMIRELTPAAVRPWPLIESEVKLQVSILERMLADLEARLDRAARAPGDIVVLDTNLLLHYLPVAELPWTAVAGSEQVRLVLPLRVIEELDQKKYSARGALAGRARRLLPQLHSQLGSGGSAARITDGVSLEVLVDQGHRYRPADADEEILDVCRELAQFGSAGVSVASGDTAMLIRAEAFGISTVELDEKYLRVQA
jgi:hypothetical protein